MNEVLTALEDIHGVVGSFILNAQGALVCRAMPAIYPDSAFHDLGRRIVSVASAVEAQTSPVQDLVLKFDGFCLLSRQAGGGFLNVLASESVNFPALKMATNVAIKQIGTQMSAAVALPPAPQVVVAAAATPAAAPVSAPAAPVAAKPRRMWRGQYVE